MQIIARSIKFYNFRIKQRFFGVKNRTYLEDWYVNFRSEADLVDEDEDSIDLKCHKFRGNTEKCFCEQEKRRLAQNGIFIQSWIVEIKIGIPKGLKPSFAGQIEVISGGFFYEVSHWLSSLAF